MQILALIPFAALLVSAAFMAVSIAWSSDRRATGSMTAIFACTGAWAGIELLGQLESETDAAVFWLKLIHLPALLLGVCVVRLLADLRQEPSPRLRRLVGFGWRAALVLGIASLLLPEVIVGATRTPWSSWMPHYGLVSIVLVPLGGVLPLVAAVIAWRSGAPSDFVVPRARLNLMAAVVVISLAAVAATEYVLPLMGIPAPRLGALAAAVATACGWLHALHRDDDLALTPPGTARAVLSELHDGVALVEGDGTIRSANPRLAMMAGLRASQLVGMPVTALVDAALEAIREGLADRECRLASASGERIPVSLSSSCVRDGGGDVDWIVVLFRDLRTVDALRRRLLTSGRLAAVGELAAGIAHEVNNPAAFVRSDLNFLMGRLEEIRAQVAGSADKEGGLPVFEDGAGRIRRSIDGVERVAEVVGDVRGFAHVGASAGGGHAEAILEGAIRLARLERREEVSLRLAETPHSETVASGQELKQVVLALLRVLTVGSRAGGAVEIALGRQRSRLRIVLRADEMDQPAEAQVERFELAGEEALEASSADLGLAIALELTDQLGGAVRVDAPGSHALRIELLWPIEEEPTS